MKKEDNSFGVAAVILGILSIVFAGLNGIVLAIVALVFASKQQKRFKTAWGKNGKILAIIGIIVSIIVIIIFATNPELMQNLMSQNAAY